MNVENMTEEELAVIRGDALPEETPEAESTNPVGETVDEVEETEQEQEQEPEQEPAEEELPKPLMMPKSRYDSVMARLREQERENQELKTQLEVSMRQAAPQTQAQQQQQSDAQSILNEIDRRLAAAIKDGDADVAAQLLGQSRHIQNQMLEQALAGTRDSASRTTIEQIKYDNLLAQAESAVAAINPDSDTFDEGLVTEISELADAFERQGKSPSVALERALDILKPPGWREAPKPVAEARKTNVQKNVRAAKSQPPRMQGGANSDTAGISSKVNIMKLSDAEFDKLTDEQLGALRGDFA